MELKEANIKELLITHEINKNKYPDAIYLDVDTMRSDKYGFNKRYIRNSKWYILQDEDKIRAVMQIEIKNECEIKLFEVNKKYRGRGFGKIMLEKVEEEMSKKGYKKIKLFPMNSRVELFYEHLGYSRKNRESKKMEKIV